MMKKLLMITVMGASLTFSFHAYAQSQGDIRAQAGIVLGTEAAIDGVGFGINVGAEYFFSDNISGAPSYDYFFKDDVSAGFSLQTSSVNIDGRYYFFDGFYGLAGLSVARIESEFDLLGTPVSISANETGLNIGAGYNLAIGESTILNLQAKYNTPLAGLVAQAGIALAF